ncbi:hypothetical protein TPHA_0D03820 [Tetrapisispora phaffii CBS 4417]|uniref:Ataxin-10 homolog n=1 Tax=Tetrapisispora phaffii (strain ATCC 24235 / CBS 4417 / NBRC 1672 / NRRL Y-8282 / UCD 70-5) TaxID=1071381 RepID=G8BT44_TETPH|nr:hypothetical protein TPHA_0D03820 [Tetrapisispora phaffii CBS 4417]CCE63015.1 hypothetical protein TPHA_0D03820 [Tetrapisispora phaffii CBS 4417]
MTEIDTIVKIGSLFENISLAEEDYEQAIQILNPIIIRSSQDEEYRVQLSKRKEVWSSINICLSNYNVNELMHVDQLNIKTYNIRLLRGIIILLRNLSASNQDIPNELLLQNTVIKLFLNLRNHYEGLEEIIMALYITILSFLHNISQNHSIFDKTILHQQLVFLMFPTLCNSNNREMLYPYLLYFYNIIKNDDFLYDFFRHKDVTPILHNIIIEEITQNHSNLYEHLKQVRTDDMETEAAPQLEDLDIILLKIFKRISANESFAPYLERIEKSDNMIFMSILKIMQLIVTSTDDWDKFELTALMAWCYRIFEHTALEVKKYFENKLEDEPTSDSLHDKLLISLDIISKLCQFEHAKKFMVFYKGIENIISLFQVLQDNLIKINFQKDIKGNVKSMKTTNSLGDKISDETLLLKRVDFDNYHIKSTNFPECKLIIVEIITMLAYGNKEVQDKIRELHGLQLVLSNCMIDDNDPFIKERAIVCIRVLLTENKENQDFVAQLESKKAVQNETLEEAGYEVKVSSDGSVKLESKDGTSSLNKRPKIK